MMKTLLKKAQLLYISFVWWTPLPLLTSGEALGFNVVVFGFLLLMSYWMLVVMPSLLVQLVERTYYYLTGNTLGIKVLLSVVTLHLVVNRVTNTTLFEKKLANDMTNFNARYYAMKVLLV